MTSGSEAAKYVSNKRGTLWEDREVNVLIAMWGEDDIQAKLNGATRKIKLFEVIAQKLKDLDSEGRTAIQCGEKIKKLKGNYRKIKAHNRSGRKHQTYKYLVQFDSILGHRPASQPPVVLQCVQHEANPKSLGDLETQTVTGGESSDNLVRNIHFML